MPVACAALLSFVLAAAALAAPLAVTLDLKDAPLAEALARFQGVTVEDPSGLAAKAGPVTLAAKDLDADVALYSILRPQGLECVWLADNRVRLYPAESAVGMAKTAGRSLRTFVSLIGKLEKAISEGDEVRVPEWLDSDDTRLAQAVIDFSGAMAWFNTQGQGKAALPQVLPLFDSPDTSFRVGASHAILSNLSRADADTFAKVAILAKDPDPDVRAMGVVAAAGCLASNNRRPESAAFILPALADPAPQVRLVATLASLDNREAAFDYSALLKDPSPSIRIVAVFLAARKNQDPAACQALIADPNPIVRAVAAAFAGPLTRDDAARKQALDKLTATEDPWLRVCLPVIQVFYPASMMKMDFASFQPKALEMLQSSKPSHRVAGAVATLFTGFAIRMGAPGGQAATPDNLPIEDPNLWVRLAAFMLASSPTAPNREAVMARWLLSPNEAERLAALALSRLTAGRIGSDKAGLSTPQSRAAIAAAAKSALYAERALAASALTASISFDDLLAPAAEALKQQPLPPGVPQAFTALLNRNELMRGGPDGAACWNKVLDIALATPSDDVQIAAIRQARWMLYNQEKDRAPLAARVIKEARPAALPAMFEDQHFQPWALRQAKLLVPLFDRLDQELATQDPAAKRIAVLAMTAFLAKAPDMGMAIHWNDKPAEEKLSALLGKMAAWAAAQPDGASLCARLLEPLAPTTMHRFQGVVPWTTAPDEARQAAITTLAKISDPACSPDVARMLNGILKCDGQWDGRASKPLAQAAPDLWKAALAAQEAVMAKGNPADQAQVLIGAAQNRTPAFRAEPAAEIQRRLMASGIPAELVPQAVQALTASAGQLTPDFLDFALENIAKAGSSPALGLPLQELLVNAARASRTHTPRPPWLDKAAACFADKITDAAIPPHERQRALSIYGRAAVDGSVVVKARLFDEKEAEPVRITAVEMITEVDPTTTSLKELAQEALFAKLSRELQQRAAQVAARARETPGAEDFVIAYLKTKPPQDQPWQMQNVLHQVQLPETPALRAAIEALINDPHAGNAAKHVLRNVWRHKDVPEGGSPAPSYEKLLAGLKDSAWKKEDPIEKNLTWYGLKPGLAVADSQAKTVTRNAGLLGDDKTTVNAIAFEERRVWLGTERGLIAWDRKAKFFSRMAVTADLFDAPVVSLEMKDATLHAVIKVGKDKTQAWLFDTTKNKWTQEPAQ